MKELVSFLVMESFDENGDFNIETFKKAVEREGGEITEEGDNLIVGMEDYDVTVDAKTGEILGTEKAGGVRAKFDVTLYTKEGTTAETGTKYEELILTVNVTNKDEIESKGGIITEIKVKAPSGDMITANETVTGSGDKSFKVNQKGTYIATVETDTKGIKRTVTKEKETDELIEIPEFSRAYGTIDIRFINGTGNETTEGTQANEPVLGTNMTPVNLKSDNSGWEETTKEKWEYSYTDTAGASKWANAVVKDENGDITGYFVWIPRYAYKITYHNGSIEGETIGYSDSRGIVRKDGNLERVYTGGESNRRNAGDNFIVHPSFTDDVNVGGWDKELQGIWVAKYEASKEISTDGTNWIHSDTVDAKTGNILTTNAGNKDTTKVRMVSKPGVSSWRNIEIGKIYQNSEGYNTILKSHLMKNSEWGACSYLGYSNYGKGATKVEQNTDSSYTTGGNSTETTIYGANAGQSTTGNAYGIYDMCGGSWEYLASYVNNGNSALTEFGSPFATTDKSNAESSNKVMVYKASNSETEEILDDQAINYKLSGESMFGDATFETTTSCKSDTGAWNSAYTSFSHTDYPFFSRSGDYDDFNSGVFNISTWSGYRSGNSFRLVLVH